MENKNHVWLHRISRKICLFFLQNSFLAILMLISRKLVQRRGTGEKYGFFAGRRMGSCRPSPKGQEGQSMWRPFYASFQQYSGSFFHVWWFFKISFKPCLNMVETFLLLCCCYSVSFSASLLTLMNTRKHTQHIPLCGDKRHMQFTFIEGMSNDQLTTEKALSDDSK